MKKYFAVIRTTFLNSLAYRADFFFWGTNELLSTLIFIFIWLVIFGEKQVIGGFNLPETITYLIGVGIIESIIFTWAGQDLERDIKSGWLSNFLIKPLNYPFAKLFEIFSNKPIDFLIRLIVYFIIALFFKEKFIINTNLLDLSFFIIATCLAIFISYLMDFTFGCISFWTTANRGMFGIFRTINSIFAGGYAPISFFPKWFQTTASFLPFSYTRYFPMLIYLKKIAIIDIFKGFAIQIAWIVILLIILNFAWKRGIKRYEGVGI